MGSSLQLELENLTFSGSIFLGCRQTFPGPEHEWHWNVYGTHALWQFSPFYCAWAGLLTSLSSKGWQGGTGGYHWLTERKKGRSQENRRCSDINQLMEMGLAMLKHCGTASMATTGRRISIVLFSVVGSVKKKRFENAALEWYGLLYYLFCRSSLYVDLGLDKDVAYPIWTSLGVLYCWLVFRCGIWMHKRGKASFEINWFLRRGAIIRMLCITLSENV